MKALILNGGLANQEHLMSMQKVIEEELGSEGWDVDPVLLREVDIRGCLGCFKCWDKTPGLCIQQKDEAREIVAALNQGKSLADDKTDTGEPVLLEVSPDGSHGYRTIQAAIDAVPRGGSIRIRAGDYAENLEIKLSQHEVLGQFTFGNMCLTGSDENCGTME